MPLVSMARMRWWGVCRRGSYLGTHVCVYLNGGEEWVGVSGQVKD